MYLKLSLLAMLGLACTSCATSSGLTRIGSIENGGETIHINRRADGGLMVSTIAWNGRHRSKAAITGQFNRIARNTGCLGGAVPRYNNTIEINSDRMYMLSTFYKCS